MTDHAFDDGEEEDLRAVFEGRGHEGHDLRVVGLFREMEQGSRQAQELPTDTHTQHTQHTLALDGDIILQCLNCTIMQ